MVAKKNIVNILFDFDGSDDDNPDFFAIPKGWGKEFKHTKKIDNKGWIFELSESYSMFEGDLDTGLAGRNGEVILDLVRTPLYTLPECVYNSGPKLLRHKEEVDGDEYNIDIIPMVDFIHLIYNKLGRFVKSQDAINIYRARIQEIYKKDIYDILKEKAAYQNACPWVD